MKSKKFFEKSAAWTGSFAAIALFLSGCGSAPSSTPVAPAPSPSSTADTIDCIPVNQPIGFTITNGSTNTPTVYNIRGGQFLPFGQIPLTSTDSIAPSAGGNFGTIDLNLGSATSNGVGTLPYSRTNAMGDVISFNITFTNYSPATTSATNPTTPAAAYPAGVSPWYASASSANITGVIQLGPMTQARIMQSSGQMPVGYTPNATPTPTNTVCIASIGLALSAVPGSTPGANVYGNVYLYTLKNLHGAQLNF